jgi:hypothetical protein
MVAALGATLTFGLFALISCGSIFFIFKFAPETRGRSLEELEDDFRTHKRITAGSPGTHGRPRLMTGTLAGGPVLTVQPEIAAIVNPPEIMVSMIAAGEMVIRPAHAPPQVGWSLQLQ